MEEIDKKNSNLDKTNSTEKELIDNFSNVLIKKDDKDFWTSKGFEKIPNAKSFAKGGFQRADVIILIDITKDVFKKKLDSDFSPEFEDLLNHFLRNGAYGALTGEDEKKKKTYANFLYLIDSIRIMDDKQILSFLEKMKEIKELQKEEIYEYQKGLNRIEAMVEEIKFIKS